ncbi:MAG: tRNA (adenosine(37)-N6)-threonylcarbamoyltransferase complex ATPase subunit type 1 TsaE [Anaerolineales bacterium]|nr:tRNA (adenosine(37)-N6)-threonylcarbamoyltransferase complex ATPase subunit type 1 TsaE [Anaerolineales bacterium]
MKSLQLLSHTIEQTLELGSRLGQNLSQNHCICISGELGAGKTTFVRGVGQGWQSIDRITSPTYTIINVYRRQPDTQTLYHLDAYRLESPHDFETIGYEDLTNGPIIIEWPERIEEFLPTERLLITIDYLDETQRLLTVTAYGSHHEALLDTFNPKGI